MFTQKHEAAFSDLGTLRSVCSACSIPELFAPAGLSEHDIGSIGDIVLASRKLPKGSYLYRAGDEFSALYAVRTGYLKSTRTLEDGREQVTGFLMAGDLVGLCGIGSSRHVCNAIALETSEVFAIPFERLEELSREVPSLQRHFHRLMSREISREQKLMMMLGSMSAEERLAAFLLDISQQHMVRGFSPTEFHLRMTRDDIGSYLGLQLETVSRVISKFKKAGIVEVNQKRVRIADRERLRAVISLA
ncbi:MAG: fumarate/nitrate reduction transcriptional regulator Fnr [Burkholderiales bacterium]